MLIYLDYQIVFQEVPDEITLAINLTQCPIKCKGCHSPELQGNIGKGLGWKELYSLILENKGITCVCFMGGNNDELEVNRLAASIKNATPLKVAWYSGREGYGTNIRLENFDYIKLGHYDCKLGSLDMRTTNQRFYKIIHKENNSL